MMVLYVPVYVLHAIFDAFVKTWKFATRDVTSRIEYDKRTRKYLTHYRSSMDSISWSNAIYDMKHVAQIYEVLEVLESKGVNECSQPENAPSNDGGCDTIDLLNKRITKIEENQQRILSHLEYLIEKSESK